MLSPFISGSERKIRRLVSEVQLSKDRYQAKKEDTPAVNVSVVFLISLPSLNKSAPLV